METEIKKERKEKGFMTKNIPLPGNTVVLIAMVFLFVGYPGYAKAEVFYQGKTISIIVGYAA
jgi:hypothetical protein